MRPKSPRPQPSASLEIRGRCTLFGLEPQIIEATLEPTSREQEMVRESEEDRFRLLVDSVQDYAIFMLSPEGTVVTWNAGAQRVKGYLRDEIVGQPITRFYLPEDAARGLPAALLARAAAE